MRKTNANAIKMYSRLGYHVYREILEYYSSNNESAYDMRIAISENVDRSLIDPLKEPIHVDEADDL